MATPNLSEIVTTTLYSRSRMIADNVTENNALLTKLKMKGKVKPFSGGREIIQELSHSENQTYKRFSGYEILDISPSEVLSSAVYPIKQSAVAVTISGLEQLQNSGREQIIDLLDARIEVAEATMANNLSADVYSDGTASAGKQINGLQALVASSPSTGTVGGINRANYSFWRNQTETGTVVSATNVQAQMQKLWVKQVRNADKPDLISMDNNFYQFFWQSLSDRQRFTSETSGMAKAGWDMLKFNTADVVLDGGVGGSSPANRGWFLNCSYLFWRPHRDRDMVPLDNGRYSNNQDAMVQLILWAGNLCMSNAKLQGVLTN